MLIRTTITLLTTVASNANNRLVSSYSPLVRGYYVAIRCLFYMHLATERPPTGYHYFFDFSTLGKGRGQQHNTSCAGVIHKS